MFDAIWSGVFTLCINIAKSAVRVFIFAVMCHYAKLPKEARNAMLLPQSRADVRTERM